MGDRAKIEATGPNSLPTRADALFGRHKIDLAAVTVGEARFGQVGAHATLAAAYGYDVTTESDWPLLREARELKMVVAAVPLLPAAQG